MPKHTPVPAETYTGAKVDEGEIFAMLRKECARCMHELVHKKDWTLPLVQTHVCRHAFVHVYMHAPAAMLRHAHWARNMCADVCVVSAVGMCVDECVDELDMCLDICVEVCMSGHVYRRVYRRVYRHGYGDASKRLRSGRENVGKERQEGTKKLEVLLADNEEEKC